MKMKNVFEMENRKQKKHKQQQQQTTNNIYTHYKYSLNVLKTIAKPAIITTPKHFFFFEFSSRQMKLLWLLGGGITKVENDSVKSVGK